MKPILQTIRGIAVLTLVMAQLAVPSALLACPTCKDGLHEDGTGMAYAFSILFMMSMPFIIFSCWVTAILRLRATMPALSEDV